jgi:DNA-binding NarL/FixJ family response regulator
MSKAPARILLFEPTQMACELLSQGLERSTYRFTVVGTGTSAATEGTADADVAVISARLDEGHLAGFTLLRSLVKRYETLRCVMLLDQAERDLVVESFRSGAVGVCERSQPTKLLCKCIHSVQHGQIWANSQQLRYVLEAFVGRLPGRLADVKGQLLLTPREDEIVCLVAEGLKNREIAETLKLSEHTVKNHIFRIFEKLGISNRAELILYLVGNRGSAH